LTLKASEKGLTLTLKASEKGLTLTLKASEKGLTLTLKASEKGLTLTLKASADHRTAWYIPIETLGVVGRHDIFSLRRWDRSNGAVNDHRVLRLV